MTNLPEGTVEILEQLEAKGAAPAQKRAEVCESSVDNCLRWFAGKPRKNAEIAFIMLAECEKQGFWLPGASRKIRAILTKANVAQKLGKKYWNELAAINDSSTERSIRGYTVAFLLSYSVFHGSKDVNWNVIHAAALKSLPPEMWHVIDRAELYAKEFAPVVKLIADLDATRPAPVFTYLGASPTVTKLLESLGLNVTASTVRVCPMEFRRAALMNKSGGTYYLMMPVLLWPENTVHNASRYDHSENNDQCQACGHAIKVADNWVPLLVDNSQGIPHSLWVGRDCAKTLFGIKMSGELSARAGVGVTELEIEK